MSAGPSDAPAGLTIPPPPSTMRRDIASAYVASISRIASWVIVSAIVFRVLGAGPFALLALVRATLGLLNYLTLGLGPAMIHHLARDGRADGSQLILRPLPPDAEASPALLYRSGSPAPGQTIEATYANGLALAYGAAIVGAIALTIYVRYFDRLHKIPTGATPALAGAFVLQMGAGTILRLASEAAGAVLQVRGLITLDNAILTAGEILWVAFALVLPAELRPKLTTISLGFLATGLLVLVGRVYFASSASRLLFPRFKLLSGKTTRSLLSFGLLVAAAQLADYLYAPTDYILINRLRGPNLGPDIVAQYAPAVQVDAGLLLLVAALSAVLLPKAAIAHAGGSVRTVRRYYVRGTWASIAMLLPAALAMWLIAPWVFRLVFRDPMPIAQMVLPLILLHTVIGGSSAVGRSILLAIGKVRPFTAAVFIAGVTNVACSYVFARYLHWGLWGIVLGTTVAVVARCAIWMPWYVLRTLRTQGVDQSS